ncbi:MAG: hypothetical protein GQ525_00115 [Draconibacterium sp.]|nr:hypothetical protein [Draconibacterium sp.]
MKQKRNQEKKILYALAIGIFVMVLAYYFGKEIGSFTKKNEIKQTSTETTNI